MQLAENERFISAMNYIIDIGGAYNQADFANKIGLTKSIISDFKSGTKRVTERYVTKLCNEYNFLSHEWILTGAGEMLSTNHKKKNDERYCLLRLLPLSAHAGTLNDFSAQINDSDCEMIISPILGADFAISVAGDSMAPEFPSGSQVLIKKINERAFIEWGKTYVLDTCNGSVIKKLFPPDEKSKDCVRCVSINPDYPPFEIPLQDVYGIYRVMLCMSAK